jgi:protein-tyrosine phosphatase
MPTFTWRLQALPPGTKVLVFCESGLGRTAFMGAAYWVMKGLSSSEAIARVQKALHTSDWLTQERNQILYKYEGL